jgi:hypothetical protein
LRALCAVGGGLEKPSSTIVNATRSGPQQPSTFWGGVKQTLLSAGVGKGLKPAGRSGHAPLEGHAGRSARNTFMQRAGVPATLGKQPSTIVNARAAGLNHRLLTLMFDPTYPPQDAEIESAPLRSQFTSLKTLIDAVPTITSAVVNGVSTLPPGDPATFSVQVASGVLSLTFGIPQGYAGTQGPPFANAIVDAVTTLAPGNPATVGVSFDGSFVHFTFGIPQGVEGGAGPQGEPGPPGEVTTAALDAELAATLAQASANSNAVTVMGQTADSSYNQSQIQALMNKVDELLTVLRRS